MRFLLALCLFIACVRPGPVDPADFVRLAQVTKRQTEVIEELRTSIVQMREAHECLLWQLTNQEMVKAGASCGAPGGKLWDGRVGDGYMPPPEDLGVVGARLMMPAKPLNSRSAPIGPYSPPMEMKRGP